MKKPEEQRMKKKLCRALPWLMVVAAYLLTITFFALYGSHNLNADDSSEMVLANLLNEEGKWILTESWLYSRCRAISYF